MTVQSLARGSATGQVQLVPSVVMAMLIFVATEIMLFVAFVSAFTIMRRAALIWPPPGQPRLHGAEAAVATVVLVASGVALAIASRRARRSAASSRTPLAAAIALGCVFVVLQGLDLLRLFGAGLTMTSSALGSFFYLIVGLHALHAVVALGVLAWAWTGLRRGVLPAAVMGAAEVFWFFVVGIWPLLFWRIYG